MDFPGYTDGDVWRAELGSGETGRRHKGSTATKKGEPTAPASTSVMCVFGIFLVYVSLNSSIHNSGF